MVTQRKYCFVINLIFILLFTVLCSSIHAQVTPNAGAADTTNNADSNTNVTNTKPEQKQTGIAAKTDNATKAALETSKYKEPEVLSVRNYTTGDSSAGISDVIVLEVARLDTLLKQADASGQNISLYINGREITNIKPLSGAPEKDKGTLQYRLDRNTENDRIWADVLGAPPLFNNNFFYKPVTISAGLSGKYAIKTSARDTNFTFIRIHRGWFWLCCAIVVLYLFVLISMIRSYGLLRDRDIDLSALHIPTNSLNNPYSLGRCQMAFWFTLTIISFFFIWLITDAYNIISTTVLALIGISTVTSISAAVIDNSKSTDVLNQTIALQNELSGLQIQIPVLQGNIAAIPAPANLADLQAQLIAAQTRIIQIPPIIATNIAMLTPKPSQGFFKDLLNDVNGVSFHRLQMFVWTFVLGLIFLYSVWKSLSMPDFDSTLLGLQGITAGTYLGFKFPEKQS